MSLLDILNKSCIYYGRCGEASCNGEDRSCEEYMDENEMKERLKGFVERYRANMNP